MNTLKNYYEEHEGGQPKSLRFMYAPFLNFRILKDKLLNTNLKKTAFDCRKAVMIGQWGVPLIVIVFALVYWILGIAKYLSG